jgi:glycosyl transferase family 2
MSVAPSGAEYQHVAYASLVRQSISACMIVLDEEERLPGALESVSFCDEIVVVDSGSTDSTVAVAEAAGARVLRSPWRGYGAQRNVAIREARSDWILEVDADERVSAALREEIERFLADPPSDIDATVIPIRHRFLGGELGPSAKYPGYRLRLFRRGSYEHDEDRTVHEGLWSNNAVFPFEGELEHLLADTWREAIGDALRYARLEARQVQIPRRPVPLAKALLLRPLAKLAYRTVVFGGWRDGWRGLSKIGLDAAADVTVGWHAVREGGRGDAPPMHDAPVRRGSPHIVGLAAAGDVDAALTWLRQADELGADTCLVTDAASISNTVRVRRLPRFSTMHAVRGTDAENQLRSTDLVVLFGRAARRASWALPKSVTGGADPVGAPLTPEAAVQLVVRSREHAGAGDGARSPRPEPVSD